MSYEKKNKHGKNVWWLLSELSACDAKDIEDDSFEVVGEDDQGREGSCEVSIVELAESACVVIEEQNKLIAEFTTQCEQRDIEQRIIGIEMVFEKFGGDTGLNDEFCVSPEQIFSLCDEIYGGDSQHIRGKQNET